MMNDFFGPCFSVFNLKFFSCKTKIPAAHKVSYMREKSNSTEKFHSRLSRNFNCMDKDGVAS